MRDSADFRSLVLLASVLLAFSLGGFLGVLWARSESGKVLKETGPKREANGRGLALPMTKRRSASHSTPLGQTLRLERRLASIDPAQFPAMVEAELQKATSSGTIFRIASVWTERDPEGFLAWMRRRPPTFTLREAGHGVGLSSTLLAGLTKKDPDWAWEVASTLPGDTERMQMSVLSGLLRRDPDRALAMVRAHRDALSLANVGSGFWGRFDPLKTVALASELLPGKARESIIRDAASYYLTHPDKIPESRDWFEQLSPDLRELARKSTDVRTLRSPGPQALDSLRSIWDEVDQEGK